MRKLIAEGIDVAEPIGKSRMFLQNAVSPRLALEDSTQPYFCANQHQEDFFQGLVILSSFIQEPIGQTQELAQTILKTRLITASGLIQGRRCQPRPQLSHRD